MVEGGALPQSLESERAVLGGLMLDPQQCLVIAETLKPEDFFRENHAKLYAMMVGMAEANKPTEMVAVIDQVIATNSAEEVGGLDYVMSLSDNVPSTQNLEYFASIVEQRAIARRSSRAYSRLRVSQVAERSLMICSTLLKDCLDVTQQGAKQDWERSTVVDSTFMDSGS